MSTVIEKLVTYCYEAEYSDFPTETIEHTKDLLLKLVTNTVVGSVEPIGTRITNYIRERRAPEEAGIVGGGFRTSTELAAWAHGVFSRACELNDDQFPADSSTVYVWPAFLSAAERFNLSGKDLLWLSIVGWEVATGLCSGHDEALLAGFGIGFGPMSIAMTLARPLGLTFEEAVSAASIGASQFFGLMKQAGSDAPNLEAGYACRSGVEAVLLAKAGATGRSDILEGARGLFTLIPGYDDSEVTTHLGVRPYDVHRVWIKKYPSCFVLHREIDALKQLVEEHDITYAGVNRIDVEVNKIDALVCDRTIESLGDSRFSFHHALAAVLLDGDVDVATFQPDKVGAPTFADARSKVNVVVHPEWPDGFFNATSIVTVEMHDGRRFVKEMLEPPGSAAQPLTRAEMIDLHRKYTSALLPRERSESVEAIVTTLEEQPDLHRLMDLLTFRENPR